MLSPGTVLRERYRVIREIGGGGFGYVYEAIDEVFGCSIALKETKDVVSTDKLRKAFEREAKLLRSLSHASLPRVTDYFYHGGAQYLVMDFIEGTDLARLLKEQLLTHAAPFSYKDVLPWAESVLEALEYLHSRPEQIIHRDIKPANIKLTPDGRIYLLDFGLAKGAAGQMSTVVEGQTSSSVPGFTREYAPLEQLQDTGSIPQTDIYSVGATLYHLLTGQLPLLASLRDEAIQKSQPDPLRATHEVNPSVPPHVSSVITQALEVRWWDRLASATAMRAALQQDPEEAISTLPAPDPPFPPPEPTPSLPPPEPAPSPVKTKASTWMITTLCTMFLLATLLVLVRYNFFIARQSASGNTNATQSDNGQPDGQPTRQAVKHAPSAFTLKQELPGHQGFIWAVAFSPDGRTLASGGEDQTIILWDTQTWTIKQRLPPAADQIFAVAFSPDGRLLATGGEAEAIKIWDTQTWQLIAPQPPLGHSGAVLRLTFSPDGEWLASTGKDRTVRLWEVHNGWMSKPLGVHSDEVVAIAFSPDSQRLASTGYDGRLILWDLQNRAKPEELKKYNKPLHAAAFSSDGRYLICGSEDTTIKRWLWQPDAAKWVELKPLERHRQPVISIAVSPDNATDEALVSAGTDGMIYLWNLQSGASKPLVKEALETRVVAFSPNGATLVGGGKSLIRVWQ